MDDNKNQQTEQENTKEIFDAIEDSFRQSAWDSFETGKFCW